jgi:DNA replication protein DnaC
MVGALLEGEASWRQDKRLAGRLRVAKLRQQACVEDVDYRSPRGLDRALFQKLVEGEWINAHDNLALIGPTGVGKSWLASALGHKACRDNRSVLYQRVPRLFEELALTRGDGRHPRILRDLGRADLLTLDDWELEPLDAAARNDLLKILEEHGQLSARRGPPSVDDCQCNERDGSVNACNRVQGSGATDQIRAEAPVFV